MVKLLDEKKFFTVIKVLLEQLPTVLPCSAASIFILRPQSFTKLCEGLINQKSVLDGRFIDVIGLVHSQIPNP